MWDQRRGQGTHRGILGGALRDRRRGKRDGPRGRAIVDGSNIMHWRDGEPSFDPLHDVIHRLKALGFAPGVMFDANAGYLLAGRYLDDSSMAKRLKMREDAVVVVAKGSPADPVILTAARELGAIVISNDRYRDWAEAFPEVKTPGTLVRGGYRSGQLWLECEPEKAEDVQGLGKR
nr:hypothetical protein [Aliiroseovarius lamellibrachiae]